ncbi:Deoxyuridine 5'-triphosphate nucleotidohydrolase (plasmid) [Blattabacterium sp. (Nauphoeta cinerea)]|uniref:dUTP diphosphatase n=1 Tax=Blattabacterium sp. (Nauphoeta cinerea) TaxID=1316444 RepID=UPI0003B0CB42|nr:dUTP diphosphatase [Blattabacterium sp. (Nauphoeta cinerea)]AGW86372.1 Deoxyuridine 5'-triphosphate nucleotidohydrolase [Blattabacterium sp. (Nauphoeta cinerea)]
MYNITIKISNISSNPLPIYETKGSSGMDLRASLKKNIIIFSMERKIVKTGLFIEIPKKYEAQIRPRSGLALYHGITVLNNPGTIDSDYRGEIKILLFNLSKNSFIIKNGDKIAQIIFFKYKKIKWDLKLKIIKKNN